MRRSNLKKTTVALALGGALTSSLFSLPSLANSQDDNPRLGLPGRRISGGSRSPNTACLTTPDQPVVALIPKSSVGLTRSAHPTLWFSLPGISPDRSLEFGLIDESGELLYQKNFSVPTTAGIVSLQLPETIAPLVAGKNYRWNLSVVCNAESLSENLSVAGWIQRVEPTQAVRAQANAATDQERLSVNGESSLWYDALTTLAELRRDAATESEALEQRWVALLASIELSQVSSDPFSSSLTPAPQAARGSALFQN